MKAKFESIVKALVSQEKDKFLAKASLQQLEGLIPEEVRGEKNIDLLPVVFNLAVVGVANKNDDLIDRQTAIEIYKQFIHRPFNIEHEREKIVGHIVGAGFSEYGTDKPLSLEEIQEMEIFNLAVSAVVYATVNENITSFLNDAADPLSENFMKASASWELGFEKNKILVESKFISEGKVIEGDEAEELEQHLKASGGSGKDEQGRRIFRLISTDVSPVFPLGGAVTLAPAADVKGIETFPNKMPSLEEKPGKEKEENTEVSQEQEEIDAKAKEQEEAIEKRDAAIAETLSLWKKHEKLIKSAASDSTGTVNVMDALNDKFSQSKKDCVKPIKLAMTEQEFLKTLKDEAAVAAYQEIIKEKIEEAGKTYVAEKEAKEKAEQSLAEAQKEAAELKARVEKIEAEAADRESEAKFNERMAALDEEFELDNELRRVITEEIDGLTDEAFASWKSRFDVMARKNKRSKAPGHPEKEEKEESEAEKEKRMKEEGKTDASSKAAVEEIKALKEELAGVKKLQASFSPTVTTNQYEAAMSQISGKNKKEA